MRCEQAEPAIALDVGGELPASERASLEAHLAACPRCREFLRDLESSQALLRSFSEQPLDEEAQLVRSRVLAQVAGRGLAQVPRRRLSPWPATPARFVTGDQRRFILLAAGLGLLALAGVFVRERDATWQSQTAPGPQARSSQASAGPTGTAGVPARTSQAAGPLSAKAASASSPRDLPASPRPGAATPAVVAQSTKPALWDQQSTKSAVESVFLAAKARSEQPALTKEEADQLARAVVVISRRIRDADAQAQVPDGSVVNGGVVQLATADPGVVIYWQIDSNGG